MENAKHTVTDTPYFVVNPANRHWLLPPDDPAHARAQRGVRIGFLSLGCFFGIFVAAGIFMAGMFVYQLVTQAQLQFSSATTRATYVSRMIDEDSDGDTYYVTYTYGVNDRTYTVEESVSRDFYNRADSGEPFLITYALNNPAVTSIDGANWGVVAFLGVFTVIWNAITWGALWSVRVERQKAKRLQEIGTLISGELTEVSSYDDSDNGYTLKVAFRFRSPLDQSLVTGTLHQPRHDLKGTPLPIPPVPIQVVFADNTHYLVV